MIDETSGHYLFVPHQERRYPGGMHIDIRGRDLWLTPALSEYVSRRVRFALGRFAGRVRRVDIRMADINGPRAGVDKRCRVRVDVGGRAITVDELDRDLYVAIDRAVDRVGRATSRAIDRLRAA
jgi:ribosomal subunit interface protein